MKLTTLPYPQLGPLDLLIIQPTPFCNLDCDYCYLPNRQSTRRMASDVLDRIFQRVFESDLPAEQFTVVWHAGEPMVLPPRFYDAAMTVIAKYNSRGVHVDHSFQTNGTLVTPEWCDFIKKYRINVGVSVDGPGFLHDLHRTTRKGHGTIDRVVRGMDALHDAGIPFNVISVLTRDSLDYPDEMFDFFSSNGVSGVGFNIEEIEGPNTQSSLCTSEAAGAYRRFLSRFFDLAVGSQSQIRVREFASALGWIQYEGERPANPPQMTTPYAITSIDIDGNFSTYSPELLGLKSDTYGDFVLGNVRTDSFAAAASTAKFWTLSRDIQAGTDRCRRNCPYFGFCGGGAPSNKYFENGSFDSEETMFCRLNKKVVADLVLEKLGA